MADTDLIERATKAIDLFDAICDIHDPAVSAHDRRVRAMAKILEAAPSPSPAPEVVEALIATKDFIALEYADARQEQYGEWLAPEARKVFGIICEALASLSQPAKGEGEQS